MDLIVRMGLIVLAGFFLFDYVPSLYSYVTGREADDILASNTDELADKCAHAATPAMRDMWCGLYEKSVLAVEPAAGPEERPGGPRYSLTRKTSY